MDTDTFWDIISQARAGCGAGTPFNQALVSRLAQLSLERIMEFDEVFGEVRTKIFRWDVWAAAYLIAGGCSDDSFMDFTAGVIAQGRDWYDKVAGSPDSLADHPAVTAPRRNARAEESAGSTFWPPGPPVGDLVRMPGIAALP